MRTALHSGTTMGVEASKGGCLGVDLGAAEELNNTKNGLSHSFERGLQQKVAQRVRDSVVHPLHVQKEESQARVELATSRSLHCITTDELQSHC
jgi:hypothetical protein